MQEPATLDVRTLICPLPVIKTQIRMQSLKTGERLKIRCTDPGALRDIPAWCKVHGHHFLYSEDLGQEITLLIEKNG